MALPPVLRDRLRLPVIGSPLFIISGPDLVIAQCKAGIVGSFPALNARPISQLDEWLAQITEELADWDRAHPEAPSAPFAVNQIVHKTNNRLEEDVELCAKYRVPLVITSLGAREDVNAAVHGWGGIILHDVINQSFAHKAIEKGADGLIPPAPAAMPAACRPSPSFRSCAPGSTGRSRSPAPSPMARRYWPPRPWAPTWPISARPSSPPRRRGRPRVISR
jgi:nitronate monooxygenase